MSKTFTVISSNGELKVDVDTGRVIEGQIYPSGDEHLTNIIRFDIDEFHQYYKGKEYGIIEPGCKVDILDLAYWWRKERGLMEKDIEEYEPPVQDWRDSCGDLDKDPNMKKWL